MSRKFLTTGDVARALSVSLRRIRYAYKRAGGPQPRGNVAGNPYWYPSDLKAFRKALARTARHAGRLQLVGGPDEPWR